MTGAAHWRKWLIGSLAAAWLGLLVSPLAAVSERIVSDWRTGLALHGFDPVSYYTEAAPQIGRAELEHAHAGVVWRFRNEGNLAAFVKHPELYMPRFGGYDPVVIARGTATPGHPELWLIEQNRLYLFYNAENRALFKKSLVSILAAAETRWPKVMMGLMP